MPSEYRNSESPIQVSVAKERVPSVPRVLEALAAMECELDSAKTYEAIRKIVQAAEALKILRGEVTEVKQKAEWVILVANQRIDQEIEAVPKATQSGRLKLPGRVNSKTGRGALGIPGTSRARLRKLGALPKPKLEAIATQLWQAGKDATMRAVVSELKDAEIKDKRADYEARAERGGDIGDLIAMAEAGEQVAVMYADPPWEFKVYSGKGKQRSAERHYDTSSLEAIKALPVAPLAAKDCALFLWCVMPELPGALEVIKAWGFEYKTVAFVWVKQNRCGEGLFTGMGYWTRANAEMCLLATRGSPERMAKDVHQIIMAPVGAHSSKPEETRKRIERLLLGPYLELFCRQAVPGWTVWGNEVDAAENWPLVKSTLRAAP